MMRIFTMILGWTAGLLAVQASAAALAGSELTPLTRQQAVERADALFDQFDLNHDGFISRDEAASAGGHLMMQRAMTGRDVAPGIGGHTLKFMERVFAGVDRVGRKQFEHAMLTHFDQMDVNHDGILSAAERSGSSTQVSSRSAPARGLARAQRQAQ